ncbi:MAG TPA: Flp family type IVb pilin [Rhizomicrobium sp.]|jgi:pilus assembly protein Flp/PilA|nr:Flp family type IVb pilin [Rhizomicrobium sp.]
MRMFLADVRGATAIEYALIAGLLSVLIVSGATVIGTKLSTIFTSVQTGL